MGRKGRCLLCLYASTADLPAISAFISGGTAVSRSARIRSNSNTVQMLARDSRPPAADTTGLSLLSALVIGLSMPEDVSAAVTSYGSTQAAVGTNTVAGEHVPYFYDCCMTTASFDMSLPVCLHSAIGAGLSTSTMLLFVLLSPVQHQF